jgi:kynurenine formamidase
VRVVDLTQRIGVHTDVWPAAPRPTFRAVETLDRDGAFARTVTMFEHTGTHIDAPAHFVSAGATVDQLTADRLVRPLAIIDIVERCASDPDYALTCADLKRDIATCGPIEPGSVVAARTGWDARIGGAAYLTDPPRFPGFSVEAADWLTRECAVEGLAIDSPGIDPGHDAAFSVHSTITLPRDVWHLEGLVNLGQVPARGAMVVVGALPLIGGSGAPARVFALVPAREEALVSHRAAYRITTFVPPDHLDTLLEAVERHTPLIFGPYDRSAWWAAGTEQFRPLPDASPTVGEVGNTERVPTVRLEFTIPRDADLLERIVSDAVLSSHPWEEPAVFIDECFTTATRMR